MTAKHTARERLRAEIVAVVKDGLNRYYKEFPERFEDERSADALAWSWRGAKRVLDAIDHYEIRDKRNGGTHDGRMSNP